MSPRIKIRRFINRTRLMLHGYWFISSAITFFDSEFNFIEITGKRHPDCLMKIREMGLTDQYKQWYEDGFIVKIRTGLHFSGGMFISRDASTHLCERHKIKLIGAVLTSEDLW